MESNNHLTVKQITENLKNIQADFENSVLRIATAQELEDVRVRFLGRKGMLTEILKSLKDFSVEDKKIIGPKAQALKELVQDKLSQKISEMENKLVAETHRKEWIDVSAPGHRVKKGHLHPLTLMERKVCSIFERMGFAIVGGPELETEWYNFDALNIPKDHPARDLWDTFWIKREIKEGGSKNIKSEWLMRTHTSPVQARFMEKHNPPLRIIAPGRVFRFENANATHEIQFYQIEGLMVGPDVSFANMKAILAEFLKELFGKDSQVRYRPTFFPFVEPGLEVDVSCFNCGGKGCAVCKRTGWVEILGAGMVHPAVFRAAGYNPQEVSGFAFGMGLDRLAMLKYKIDDTRLFYQNDLRFLKQF